MDDQAGDLALRDPVLPVCPPPKDGESLLGYLLRLTERNGYENLSALLDVFGIAKNTRQFTAGTPAVRKLQDAFGMEWPSVERLPYFSDPTRKNLASFMGHPIIGSYLHTDQAKVCPHCLAERGFVPGFWDLAPYVACPYHRCYLVSQCPSCESAISWDRAGVTACRCGQDLSRLYAGPAPDDVVSLMLLIEGRAAQTPADSFCAPEWAKTLAGLDLDGIIHAVVSLGRLELDASDAGTRQATLRRVRSQTLEDDIRMVTAAIRILREWPASLDTILDSMAGQKKDTFSFRPNRRVVNGITASMRSRFRHNGLHFVVDEAMRWAKAANARHSVSLLSATVSEPSQAPRRDLSIGHLDAVDYTGLPRAVFDTMVALGHLQADTAGKRGARFTIAALDAFQTKIRAVADASDGAEVLTSLRNFLLADRLGATGEHLRWLCEDVMSGALSVWAPPSSATFMDLSAKPGDLVRYSRRHVLDRDGMLVSIAYAAEVLGCSPAWVNSTVRALEERGVLRTVRDTQTTFIHRSDLDQVRACDVGVARLSSDEEEGRDMITLSEAARRVGRRFGWALSFARQQGVPVTRVGVAKADRFLSVSWNAFKVAYDAQKVEDDMVPVARASDLFGKSILTIRQAVKVAGITSARDPMDARLLLVSVSGLRSYFDMAASVAGESTRNSILAAIEEAREGDPDLVTVEKAASVLGRTQTKISKALRKGGIKMVQVTIGKRRVALLSLSSAKGYYEALERDGQFPGLLRHQAEDPDLITVADAVARTGCPRTTLLGAIRSGRLKAIEVNEGGKRYFLVKAQEAEQTLANRSASNNQRSSLLSDDAPR